MHEISVLMKLSLRCACLFGVCRHTWLISGERPVQIPQLSQWLSFIGFLNDTISATQIAWRSTKTAG